MRKANERKFRILVVLFCAVCLAGALEMNCREIGEGDGTQPVTVKATLPEYSDEAWNEF